MSQESSPTVDAADSPRNGHPHPRRYEHFVRFYEADESLLAAVADFAGNGLHAGGTAVLVATREHLEGVAERLSRLGHDLVDLAKRGRLVALDARETLDRLLVAGSPDPERFEEIVGGVVRRATASALHPRVWAFGEMVALLWAEGRAEAALRLERLWNDLAAREPLSLLCAYPMSAFAGDADGRPFAELCAEHGRVIPSERWNDLAAADRDCTVADLQRRALALDREVARRRALEEALRRRDKELSEVLESTRDGVVDLDPDGRVRWGNRAFLALVGHDGPVGALEGDVAVEDPSVFADVLGRMLRGETVAPRPVALRTRGGGRVVARLQAGTLRTEGRALQVRWFLRPEAAAPSATSEDVRVEAAFGAAERAGPEARPEAVSALRVLLLARAERAEVKLHAAWRAEPGPATRARLDEAQSARHDLVRRLDALSRASPRAFGVDSTLSRLRDLERALRGAAGDARSPAADAAPANDHAADGRPADDAD